MTTPLRVLIVEDKENHALLMLRELQCAGYAPFSKRVATRETFLAELKQEEWDVVLIDYSMPKFNSSEVIEAARGRVSDLPFIIVAGAIGEEAVVAAMKAGAYDYVREHNLSQLGSVIDRALGDVAAQRERRKTEQKLRDRDSLFRSVIENVSDLIVIVEKDGGIRYHSPSVGRVLGYGSDDLAGTFWQDYLHPDERSEALEALARLDQNPQDVSVISCQVRHKDGSWRAMEGTATNLLADPAVRGILCNFCDVTQKRRSQRQLALAQRMESIGNLAGGIAHDLNNLLTPILVAAEMLQDELPPPDRKMLLEGLLAGAHRAADVVHRLLSFARGIRTDQGVAQVGEVIRETEQLLRFGFPKSITIQTTLPETVWPVLIGATEFVQVLMNFCVNARDAMPDGGRLSISVRNVHVPVHDAGLYSDVSPGRYVVLSVADTGRGMPSEVQKRIFEPYFTTKGNEGGTGLGLPTTQVILQNHGGRIKVYSDVGRGTRFSAYIPAAPAPHETPVEPGSRSWLTGQGELVLVIDDEASIREVLKETLEAHNYRVVTAANGATGLMLYRDHADDIDLVIVDLVTPIMDGQATITAIRKLNPRARIILQSGLVSVCNLPNLRPHAADVFLEKPYATEVLLQSVHDLLKRN